MLGAIAKGSRATVQAGMKIQQYDSAEARHGDAKANVALTRTRRDRAVPWWQASDSMTVDTFQTPSQDKGEINRWNWGEARKLAISSDFGTMVSVLVFPSN